MTNSPAPVQLRRWMYGLLILIAFGMACGRIVSECSCIYEPAFHRR